MKKGITLLAVFFSVLVLSGCSKTETLSCSKEQKVTGANTTSTMNMTFVNDKVNKINIDIKMEIETAYVSYLDTIKSSVKSSWSKYDNIKGVTLNISSKDNVITASANFNLDKMSTKDKKSLDLVNATSTKAEAKKELKAEGFTCK